MDSKVPKVRFRGFNVDWERKSLGDLCESLTYGLNAAAVKFDGENKYLRITDIDDDSRTFIKTGLTSPKVDLGASQDYLLRVGDIVFARTGASVGKSYLYKETDGRVFFAGFLIRARVKAGENAEFIFQNTLTMKYDAFVKLTSQRSGQPGINAKEYSSFSFLNPTETSEKNKIGTYFKELDRLIELHQHKHNKLVALKQAMLQRMFPQDGATTPEIRFKGFIGDWQESTLIKEAIITTGFPFESSNFSDSGEYLVVTNGNIQNEAPYVDESMGNRITIDKDTPLSKYILNNGDILVTMDGSAGRTAKVNMKNQILAQRVGRLVAKSNAEFLYQSLNTGLFLRVMASIAHGGTIKHISLSEIGDFTLRVPASSEEQKKIGDYFRVLDELISQHSTQLNKLKQIKSACLEKMFV